MSESWREILIDVEPRGKEFRLGVEGDATPADILSLIEERCRDEGVNIAQWAQKEVGGDYQLVFLRKSEGNAILAPGVPLEKVDPPIENNERFKIGAQPVVGFLPVPILNRRVERLVTEFYQGALHEIYQREGWHLAPFSKQGHSWQHPQFSLAVTGLHRDGAYHTINFHLQGLPGVVDVKKKITSACPMSIASVFTCHANTRTN